MFLTEENTYIQGFQFGSMLTLFITAGLTQDIYLIIAYCLFVFLYMNYLLKIVLNMVEPI